MIPWDYITDYYSYHTGKYLGSKQYDEAGVKGMRFHLKPESAYSLVPRLEAGLSGTHTANTHPLSLVRFDVESSLIGLMKHNTKIHYLK